MALTTEVLQVQGEMDADGGQPMIGTGVVVGVRVVVDVSSCVEVV